VSPIRDGSGDPELVDLTREECHLGHTVSIFTHTKIATASLSDALSQAGLTHEQVGFGEAYGEALAAQLALIQYAIGDSESSPRRSLAVFLTACDGKKDPPPLACDLLNKTNSTLEQAINRLAADLTAAGKAAPDLGDLAEVVAGAWTVLGMSRGQETWSQAAKRTARALSTTHDRTLADVSADLLRSRDDALVGNHAAPRRRIEVMNLHQTKGREADTTILLLGPDEFHGREVEPFPEGSRLLYVVMTRARQRAHIVVPDTIHPLWQPLVAACRAASRSAGIDGNGL
jgi:DNA helicase-2/ATP-dependent DNA helicase PcrA